MSREAAAVVRRDIRRTRVLRVVAVLVAVLNAFMLAVNIAIGSPLASASAATIVALLVLIVKQTRLLGTMRRRERELNRPRMTLKDWRHLREMETELGWVPSEIPPGMDSPPPLALSEHGEGGGGGGGEYTSVTRVALSPVDACECYRHHLRACKRLTTTASALSGTGSLSAKPRHVDSVWSTSGSGRCLCGACQQSMREARGKTRGTVAAEHFAQLARVGRESCISYCHICADREQP